MKCFLAANSAEGFVSYFKDCFDPDEGWGAYIIKGGPGTGKSSFMRRLLKRAKELELSADEVYCASDPASLDGVIIPQIKRVIIDGTAPHIVEPIFPGAVEQIVDFGRFWNENELKAKRKEILELTRKNKALHKKASERIVKAGELLKSELELAPRTSKRGERPAEELIKKYLTESGGGRKEWNRFSCGVTPKGFLCVTEPEDFDKTVIIDGNLRFASGAVECLKREALKRRFEAVVFKNPILPSLLTDGIALPELSLYVRVNTDNLLKGQAKELIADAAEILKEAKENHDALEKCYIEAMDFETLNAFCEKACAKFFD